MTVIAPHLAAIELQMHRRLFGFERNQLAPVSDADMWRILRQLRAAAVLEPFRLWLVGSRVEPGRECSDIDLVLSPRARYQVCDVMIERALWHCRNFGLHVANARCVLDACFRAQGPTLGVAPLQPHTVLQTIKLFSPKLARLVHDGRIAQYRRLGHFSIEYQRRAADTEYYGKLPIRTFDGALSSYLRPAVEVNITGDPI